MISFQEGAEVFPRIESMVSLGRLWVALVPLLFAAACSQPQAPSLETPSLGELRRFEGTWSASGTRQTLNLGTNQRATIFDLTGSLLRVWDRELGVGFQAQAIGFKDSLAGTQGRCVWTDERGNKIYSELKGEFAATGNRIVGTFLGGTRRYAGVTGEYSFQWQFVGGSEDGAVSGALDLKGRARLSTTDAAPHGERSA
jgi:hypothetical protein